MKFGGYYTVTRQCTEHTFTNFPYNIPDGNPFPTYLTLKGVSTTIKWIDWLRVMALLVPSLHHSLIHKQFLAHLDDCPCLTPMHLKVTMLTSFAYSSSKSLSRQRFVVIFNVTSITFVFILLFIYFYDFQTIKNPILYGIQIYDLIFGNFLNLGYIKNWF